MPVLRNPRREALAQELFKDPGLDQYLAAERAGFQGNMKTLAATASRLLADVKGQPSPVRARIMELQGKVASRAVLTKAELLNSLAPVITAHDLGRFLRPDGSMKSMAEMDADCRSAVKSLKTRVLSGGKGKRKVATEEFERFDRRAYVELYAKLSNQMPRDGIELTGPNGGAIEVKKTFGELSDAEKLELARSLGFLLAEGQRAAKATAPPPSGADATD